MADKKISQLPAAKTPLAGTEELPLVQSSVTKKATVASLLGGLTGGIVQIVNASYNTPESNITDTFADTKLTATITPKKSSNKILVLVNQNGLYKKAASGLYGGVKLQLLRGSTVLAFLGTCGYTGDAADNVVTASISYLDTPATTSAVTYKTQFCNNVNADGVEVQNGYAVSTITLLEIAG